MTNQVIPAEAVEAAAKAEYEHEFLALEGTWADASKEVRALFRQSATMALEAAAPHIRASALEEAAQVVAEGGVGAYDSTEYADWLHARAQAERTQS